MRHYGSGSGSCAAVRRLLRWREATARRRDLPKKWLLDNELALSLARRPPRDRPTLGRLLEGARAARRLADEGFRVTARYGIGGAAYHLWEALACAALLLRRDDWVDSLHARARHALVSSDGPVEMSRLVILVARKQEGR